MVEAFEHQPVMPEETLQAWLTDPNGLYVDGTFGRGGHSRMLLQRLEADGQLLALDRDPQAVEEALRLQQQYPELKVEHCAFADLPEVARRLGWFGKVSGILLDLGVSSPQLDNAERGFSFMRDGPLDMRMDTTTGQTAAQWLAVAEMRDIANVLRDYGEEKFAARIARAIVEQREQVVIDTTLKLVELIERVVPGKEQGKHKATRTFQALRIAINSELNQLETFLAGCMDVLKPGGRLAIISFHSLEDRRVKRFMRAMAKGDEPPRHVPVRDSDIKRRLKILGRAQKAGEQEVAVNPRARSAVLRVAEKIA